MKATLNINNKTIEVELSEEDIAKLIPKNKKTGYEQAKNNECYYRMDATGTISTFVDENEVADRKMYNIANYYTNKALANNNTRADTLMRQLRRFSAEHRDREIDFTEKDAKYRISCNFSDAGYSFCYSYDTYTRVLGAIYFDTKEHAKEAVNKFKDELLWYFKEYRDTMEEF